MTADQPAPAPDQGPRRTPAPDPAPAPTPDAEGDPDALAPVPPEVQDLLFGAVYGTVLASGLLAALQRKGDEYTPFYDASWVLVTAITAALAHGYAHHMSSHRSGSAGHRWQLLMITLWREWPMVAATLPTVLLLALAGVAGWAEPDATTAGLALNTALLFTWGTFIALRRGYRMASALAIGGADACIGVAIIVANALIK
ncbi:hypothetical protein [Streptomyces sp. NPDC089799]|uniref:hypothetical protein n=1 Tax=Streptomyces sp. NPDC089799 TaxID=3155066 RepID=UPI00342F6806